MLGSSIQTVEYQQHSAPVSLFGWQICDEIKLRKISFYTDLSLRFYYEYDVSSTSTTYISSLVCPKIDDYLSLVVNRGFW